MSHPAVDEVYGSRYRLTARIAGGGMGEVWRAHDDVLGREVAIKILRREYADDPTFLARFRAEARHSANLSHPGIAAVYDFGEGDTGADRDVGSPYLVMEHVDGEPLSALVAREGALGPERTLEFVGQTALALQAAHDAGVIHRDVKPGNILVTPDGNVKITDFGIARATNSVPLTQTGAIMGTAYYISPEQASGQSVTPASDLYSLGIVAYECLTGRRPFAGDTPVSVALAQVRDEPPALPDTVPGPARALVMRLLDKDPANRPASAGALGREALALAPTLAGAPGAVAAPAGATRVLPAVGATASGAAYASSGATTTAVAPDRPDRPYRPYRPDGMKDTNPGFHLPAPSRLPHWLPYAIALVLGAVLLALLVRACGGGDSTAPVATTESTGTTAPASVQVVAVDYLGRPLSEARSELKGLGLRVGVERTAGGGTVGTVKGVAPTGTVAEGDKVTLTAVAAPSPAPAPATTQPKDSGKGGGKGKPGKGKKKGKGKR